MKIIKYNLCTCVNFGTTDNPSIEEILTPVVMGWSEANEEIAKKEAYNGEYTIEDDGQLDPSEIPTKLDILEAQVAYLAMMTDISLEV